MKRFDGKIVGRKAFAKGIFLLSIELEEDFEEVKPGNFIMLGVKDFENILPRPFSIFEAYGRNIKIVIKTVGVVTNKLFQCSLPQKVSVLGPLGNFFPLLQGNNLVVAGGIGLAPLFNLKKYLNVEKFFVGYRTKDEAFLVDELIDWGNVIISTDDGSIYNKGFITDYLEDYLIKNRDRDFNIYACGPMPFLKRLYEIGNRFYGVKIFGSFESYMACGFGVCLGCTIDTPKGYVKVCKDGPVFNLKEIFGD